MTNDEMWMAGIVDDVKTAYRDMRPEDAYVPGSKRPDPKLDYYTEIRRRELGRPTERRSDMLVIFYASLIVGLLWGLGVGYLIWGGKE